VVPACRPSRPSIVALSPDRGGMGPRPGGRGRRPVRCVRWFWFVCFPISIRRARVVCRSLGTRRLHRDRDELHATMHIALALESMPYSRYRSQVPRSVRRPARLYPGLAPTEHFWTRLMARVCMGQTLRQITPTNSWVMALEITHPKTTTTTTRIRCDVTTHGLA